jgi:hypothetical protein
MVEMRIEPLLPLPRFFLRLLYSFTAGLLLTAVALFIGMYGYHRFEHMSWLDAFVNAAMILGGMGPLAPIVTRAGKLFAGYYALFSGLVFISVIGLVFAPVVHRFLHKFHLQVLR